MLVGTNGCKRHMDQPLKSFQNFYMTLGEDGQTTHCEWGLGQKLNSLWKSKGGRLPLLSLCPEQDTVVRVRTYTWR